MSLSPHTRTTPGASSSLSAPSQCLLQTFLLPNPLNPKSLTVSLSRGKQPQQKWKPKAASSCAAAGLAGGVEKITLVSQPAAQMWVPSDYATSASSSSSAAVEQVGAGDKLSRLFKGASDFAVDNNTFTEAQIRATFYPKFENEKSDQETRTRMIEMVSHGLATWEVTLKHLGSLFMYAGHHVVHMPRTALEISTLMWAFLFWGTCFVNLGGSKLLKCKQNSMIFLRKTV